MVQIMSRVFQIYHWAEVKQCNVDMSPIDYVGFKAVDDHYLSMCWDVLNTLFAVNENPSEVSFFIMITQRSTPGLYTQFNIRLLNSVMKMEHFLIRSWVWSVSCRLHFILLTDAACLMISLIYTYHCVWWMVMVPNFGLLILHLFKHNFKQHSWSTF